MKIKSFQILVLTLFTVLVGTSSINAQGNRPRQSPKMTATGQIGEANLTISYSSPQVKGREIWGALVPYGEVWRAGANEATQLETDKDLVIEGEKLAAGNYSIYTIPGEKEWQIIISSQTGQWGIERSGETTRNPENDVLVVTVKPKKSAAMEESLLYRITKIGFVIAWGNLEVPVSIK